MWTCVFQIYVTSLDLSFELQTCIASCLLAYSLAYPSSSHGSPFFWMLGLAPYLTSYFYQHNLRALPSKYNQTWPVSLPDTIYYYLFTSWWKLPQLFSSSVFDSCILITKQAKWSSLEKHLKFLKLRHQIPLPAPTHTSALTSDCIS